MGKCHMRVYVMDSQLYVCACDRKAIENSLTESKCVGIKIVCIKKKERKKRK